jgi:hypothetical protein
MDNDGFESAGAIAQRVLGFADSAIEPSGHRAIESPPAFSVDLLLAQRPILRTALTPAELTLARIIAGRVGQAQAIRIRDLAAMLGEGWHDREVKEAVRRLREVAAMPIAATKVPPYGLFMCATAEEARDMHDRMLGEGIRLLKHSQLFGRDRDLVRVLEGQLELSGHRGIESSGH